MKEILVKYFRSKYLMNQAENVNDFMVPLNLDKDIDKSLTDSEKHKFLFFNMLFNKIRDNQIIPFLDFHYHKHESDKKNFLRTLKYDLYEIHERLVKPGRIISTNSAMSSDELSQPVIIEIMPYFDPYDYERYLNYERRIKEVKYWIKGKNKELLEAFAERGEGIALELERKIDLESKNQTEPKPDIKKKRDSKPKPVYYAYYHCFKENYIEVPAMAKEDILTFKGKNEIIEIAERLYPGIKSLYFYQEYRIIKREKIKMISFINNMDDHKREKFQKAIFEIATSFNDVVFINEWNRQILKKV